MLKKLYRDCENMKLFKYTKSTILILDVQLYFGFMESINVFFMEQIKKKLLKIKFSISIMESTILKTLCMIIKSVSLQNIFSSGYKLFTL